MALRAHGGRRIGASADLGSPSGTLSPSAKSILPTRGGGGGGRRGARTHLTSSSFTVSRCGAPSISVTSVPLVPPSARSACPQGARRIRKRQSRQRLRSRYALPGYSQELLPCPMLQLSSTTGQRQRKSAQHVSQTSPGQRVPQGQCVSVSDFYKEVPAFPRRRQEVCAGADRPAEHFFFSTGRGAFSF